MEYVDVLNGKNVFKCKSCHGRLILSGEPENLGKNKTAFSIPPFMVKLVVK